MHVIQCMSSWKLLAVHIIIIINNCLSVSVLAQPFHSARWHGQHACPAANFVTDQLTLFTQWNFVADFLQSKWKLRFRIAVHTQWIVAVRLKIKAKVKSNFVAPQQQLGYILRPKSNLNPYPNFVQQRRYYCKLEIHSVERGICPIATSTMNELFL